MTKLEILKTVLEVQESEKETIDNLILNYYNKPNSLCFETFDGNYYVYDLDELDDELNEIARGYYEDLLNELQRLIRKGSYDLNILVDEISGDTAIIAIRSDLDKLTLEEHGKIFVIEENNYFIYKEHE